MMVGDKQLEIMPLLRPFGLAMIIIWWGAFVKMVAFPDRPGGKPNRADV